MAFNQTTIRLAKEITAAAAANGETVFHAHLLKVRPKKDVLP
jgi:hypothetical protein